MTHTIDPADYERLMSSAKRRANALRRAAEQEFCLQGSRAARRMLRAMERVLHDRPRDAAGQAHQKGA